MSANYINRELSWIEFNQRVLSEAQRTDIPLLERLKFLAISASNLDEFFQVRVGGLTLLTSTKTNLKDIVGMTPTQQLSAIRQRVSQLIADQYTLYNTQLHPELDAQKIHIAHPDQLPAAAQKHLAQRFQKHIFPLLTPLPFEPDDDTSPSLVLPAKTLIVACLLRSSNASLRLALIPISEGIERFIAIAENGIQYFVPIEDAIQTHCGTLFPEETISSHTVFRITRNGDIALHEEDVIDLAGEMEEILSARKQSNAVRLEIHASAPQSLIKRIRQLTQASSKQVYSIPGPLALGDFMHIAFIAGHDTLKAPQWEPQASAAIDYQNSIFDEIAKNDILLCHPYQSFDPVIRLIEEAANDPDVVAIKQVLYRTAKHSRVVDALIRAAENGKQVTVLVEIKARFDEARNLHRAEQLQRAGVQVVYGVKRLKTHAKITLVVRREAEALKRYCHFGTGNYNESTAKLYTDTSLLTARNNFGADASLFFNAVTGRSKLLNPQQLLPAPTHIKQRLLELIASETARAKAGEPSGITAKVNSLQDKDIIDALYTASKAGVPIQLNVRGICCLKTGDRKEAKNIRVISVIDHYLEHSRIIQFHHGGDNLIFISSADWMTRNLEKRVELMIPILDKKLKAELSDVLLAAFKDNQNAHEILEDGSSRRLTPAPKEPPFRLQEHLQKKFSKAAKNQSYLRTTTFEPYT